MTRFCGKNHLAGYFDAVVVSGEVGLGKQTKQSGAAGLLVDAWRGGVVDVYVSNALAYEYAEVLARKLSEERWRRLKPVLGSLLDQAHFAAIYFTWRPVSPDPGDDLIIDCAMNTGAIVVTSNVRDFKTAEELLGLAVMTPVEAVRLLTEGGE